MTKRATRKKKRYPQKAEETDFLKVQFFFEKYTFLMGVKNRQKRVKIQPFGNAFNL